MGQRIFPDRPSETERKGKNALPPTLKQKMAQSVSGAKPSLVPVQPEPKSGVESQNETFLPASDLIADAEEVDTLAALMKRHAELKESIKLMESSLDPITDRIKAILGTYGIDRVQCGQYKASYFETTRSSLNRTKLIAHGVDEEVIDQCTDLSYSKSLRIRREQ